MLESEISSRRDRNKLKIVLSATCLRGPSRSLARTIQSPSFFSSSPGPNQPYTSISNTNLVIVLLNVIMMHVQGFPYNRDVENIYKGDYDQYHN